MKMSDANLNTVPGQRQTLRALIGNNDVVQPPSSSELLARLATFADQERVLLPLADWFERSPGLTPELAELLAARREHAELLRRVELTVRDALNSSGVEYTFLKGSSLQRLEADVPRQMVDLDLLLRDADAALAAATTLEGEGFRFGAMSVACEAMGDSSFWSGTLVLDSPHGVEVEINFGDYHPHWFTRLFIQGEFWAAIQSDGFPSPSLRWTAAILLAEMIDRRRLRLRDERDVDNVLTRLALADLDWLKRFASERGLVGELALVAQRREYLRVPALGRFYRRLREIAPVAVRIVLHDFPAVRMRYGVSRAIGAAVISGVRDSLLQAFNIGNVGRTARSVTWLLNRADASFRVKYSGLSALVPIEHGSRSIITTSDSFRLRRSGGLYIVQSSIGTFIATSVPVVSAKTYSRALNAARSLL